MQKRKAHRAPAVKMYGQQSTRSISGLIRELGPVVYYLRVGSLVKIGFTKNLADRIKRYPPDTVLLAWRIDGSLDLEAEIHTRLADSLAHGREWFHLSDQVLAEVQDAQDQCGIGRILRVS